MVAAAETSVGLGVAQAVGRLDAEEIARSYWGQEEFVTIDPFLGPEELAPLLRALDRVRPMVHRARIPGFKQSGSVSVHVLRRHAPEFLELYASPELLGFLRGLVRADIGLCPAADPHTCALYLYQEAGDRIGFHYDTSYYRGARYTVLLGLVQRSASCKLMAELHHGQPERARMMEVPTPAGSLAVFNGDKLWHGVTPLAAGEERIMLTMEYVTDPRMAPHKRAFSNLKDAFVYFGIGGVFGRR